METSVVEKEMLRKEAILSLECPLGCRFFLFCWLIAAPEIPPDLIWICLGKAKHPPLKDVPIGAWAVRPQLVSELDGTTANSRER